MTKAKRSISLSIELDNIIARLASKLGQNTSEFIEYTLREDQQVKQFLKILREASDPPAYNLQERKEPLTAH